MEFDTAMRKRAPSKSRVTARLIQSSAKQLRRTSIGAARARVLARDVGRLNDVALAAADQSDFNDEPARFSSTLVRLKSPRSRR